MIRRIRDRSVLESVRHLSARVSMVTRAVNFLYHSWAYEIGDLLNSGRWVRDLGEVALSLNTNAIGGNPWEP